MGQWMKMNRVHQSFLSGLVIVATVTIILMISTRPIVSYALGKGKNKAIYTTSESYNSHKR
jgi:hypothetical protein